MSVKITDRVLKFLVFLLTAVTVTALICIIVYILIKGIPYLKPSLFSVKYTSDNVSLLPSLITTLFVCGISLLIAVPLGIFSAVYLVEYASKSNKLVKVIRLATETLSGIPSIVYGLFGMIFFVTYLKWGYSIIAGSLTVSIMVLPLIMRTTEEALIAIPDSYREGSFGLGAGRFVTTFKIVLPAAMPGILAGVILAIGRIVGETAALIYTAGTFTQIPDSIFASGRTLAVHMYAISSEGFHTNEAYATAVVLLALVFVLNLLSNIAAKKLKQD